ncbi:HNH endonuclease [Spiribacter pallidus]|uniref:HNH endonuclease n=1 Tax=Spiribacter pallidus TaxID=1987936 RepID=A0ABV3TF93_9GAMM
MLSAYDYRCAISNLPEERLLDAAHITADGDERLGQPEVVNGLPLSKVHHAAFDGHLIGMDPDYRSHLGSADDAERWPHASGRNTARRRLSLAPSTPQSADSA